MAAVFAAMAFAVLSDPVIAGVFTLLNTGLNTATLIYLGGRVGPRVAVAAEVAEKQESNMVKREGDST